MTHHHAPRRTGRPPARAADNAAGQRRRPPLHIPHPLTPDQHGQVWAIVTGAGDDPALDELIFEMILITGARRQTVLDLTLGDLDEGECTIRLIDRFVLTNQPVPDWFLTRLLTFARARGAEQPEDRVFRYRPDSRRGGTPISRRRFDYLFTRVRQQLPWAEEARLSAHTLRLAAIATMDRHNGPAVAATFARTRMDDHTRRRVLVRLADVAAAVVVLHGGDHPWLHRQPRPRTD